MCNSIFSVQNQDTRYKIQDTNMIIHESPIALNREMCMVVFNDEFINENFPALPDRLSTSQQVYLGQFKFIQRKCEAYLNVVHKLNYLVEDLLNIPSQETDDNRVPRHIALLHYNTILPIWMLYQEIVEMKQKFEGYEQISPVLTEYWSVSKKDLPEATKQVEQLNLVLEQRKKDLALFQKQHKSKGGKGKAKRLDKSTRKEMRTLESQVKMAQGEVTSAEKALSAIFNRIVELKKTAGDRELPIESQWENMVPDSYDTFRQLSTRLLQEIRNIQELFASFGPPVLASVSITQEDLDAEKDKCVICWREYSVGDNVKACGHCKQYFDERCIEQWLKRDEFCPLCRQSPLPSQ